MTIYTYEQLTNISQTIFRYESAPHGYGSQDLHVRAAIALSTGEAHASLGWRLNTRLGVLPLDLQMDGSGDHHLDFATAFAHHPEIRDQFLAKLLTAIDADQSLTRPRMFYTSRVIPGPINPALRLPRAVAFLFHPFHAAWYQTAALQQLTTERLTYDGTDVGSYLGQIGATLIRSGYAGDQLTLKKVATKAAMRELEKRALPSTDFSSIADAISLADQGAIEAHLLKTANVYQTLLITLHEPSPKAMIAGLRAMAQYKRPILLTKMRRAPSVAELLGANVKGSADLWRIMPWEMISPAIQEDGEALRGSLFRRVEMDFADLPKVLTDHSARLKIDPETNGNAKFSVVSTRSAQATWEVFAEGVLAYFPAIRLRQILCEEYPPDVVKLIALRHLTQRVDLADYVDPILSDAARRALGDYAPPLHKSKRGTWYQVSGPIEENEEIANYK